MSSSLFDLTGETAVVIGGTGVLGGAIAQGLADAGAKVTVIGRTKRSELPFVAADATKIDSLRRAHEQTGTPTILVNAAGGNDPKATVTPEMPFEKIPHENWAGVFDLNLVGGVLFPCQVFGAAMTRGSIINIASVSAHIPLSRVVTYSAAKAAVLNLTMFLAREWAGKGVRVNSITPGFFPAEQNRRLLFKEDGTPTPRAQAIMGHTALSRFGEPKELVGAAVFLASSRASGFVTGTDLRVDGGYLSQTI
ncbi:MAG: putative oxidoreductase UxuB [Verrucomicrobiae bacterium]|nr:putative oxidoreductase UxuB [Verrucomicrobiae bacterium]